MTPAASVERNTKDDSSKTPAEIIDPLDAEIPTDFKEINFEFGQKYMIINRKFHETDIPANFSNPTCTAFIASLELGIVNAVKYVSLFLRILAIDLDKIPDLFGNFLSRYVVLSALF